MSAQVAENKDVGGFVRTKPRAPIAAQYASPGPCYSLPSLVGTVEHDYRSVHRQNPSWHFGIRHGKLKDDASPGPCYLPTHKCYRDGLDGTPHFSLHDKHKDLSQFNNPGPGAYAPEASGPTTKFQAPKFSFGTRHRHRRTDNTPGPNNYTLPAMTGKTTESHKRAAPMYSLVPRNKMGGFDEDLAKTPGPGAYTMPQPSLNRNAAPHYSMTSRNVMPGDSTQKPGPGAHSPERVYMNKKKAAQYSFGIVHTPYKAPLIVQPSDD